jgi:putative transposase
LGGVRGRLISSEDRIKAMRLIMQACQDGARKRQACKILGLSLRTVERWEKIDGKKDRRSLTKQAPKNKFTNEERNMILNISNAAEYRDLPPCKIVPVLADEGRYIASESTFYRVLRSENQLTHRGHSKPKKHHKPEQFIAIAPNKVWSWDISYLPTQITGLYFYLYLIMDIYSRKIVGWSVHEKELSDYGAKLIEQACHDEGIEHHQIVLHSDNGAPMKGITMLAMLEKLGILPSFSRPSVSDDNPYSEALFKTLKYHPTFPILTKFNSITDPRLWCEKFVKWYNEQHLHSGLKFITPQQRHDGRDKMIMQNRNIVYQKAKQLHPERWSKNTRNWSLPKAVTLNPNKTERRKQGNSDTNSTGTHTTCPHGLEFSNNLAMLDKSGRAQK